MTRSLAIAALLAALPTVAHADASVSLTDRPRHTAGPHHVRMALELGAIFAIGHEWYWRDNAEPNWVDWQLPHGMKAAEIKLTSFGGWRFDGNPYNVNAVCHPLFGTLTTFLARENGYGMAESFLISSLASGTWETFLELREYGSINDIMMTSPAGLPVGEAAYQLAHHWREARYELRGGVGVENGAGFADTAARVDLDRIPATGAGTFTAGRRVALAADVTTDAGGVRSADAAAKTTLVGRYRNTDSDSLVVALSSELDYHEQAQRSEREWDLDTMIAFGPSIDYRVRTAGLDVSVGADAYVDFGMLKSEAFSTWRTEHPMGTLRNVLEDRAQPYYYAVGVSVDPRIAVSTSGFVLGARLAGTHTSSLDGHDRDQEIVDTRLHLADTDARGEAWLGYQHDDLSVTLDGRMHRRTGTANDVEAQTGERTAILALGYRI
jgi:uncharacterized protein DUF3943